MGLPLVASFRNEFANVVTGEGAGEACFTALPAFPSESRDGSSTYLSYVSDCVLRVTFLLIPSGRGFLLQAAESRGDAARATNDWCVMTMLAVVLR